MPLINLIQEQRLVVKQREKQMRLLMLAAFSVGALSFVGAGYFTMEAAAFRGKTASLQQQVKKLEPTVKLVEQNQKEITRLRPRLTTLVSAQEGTQRWIQIFDHLSRNTPDGVWLTAVRCAAQDKKKPIGVQINGTSATQDAIGAFLLRLQSCPQLGKATLKFTQERVSSAGKGIEFQVDAEVAGSAEKADTAKDGDEAKKEAI